MELDDNSFKEWHEKMFPDETEESQLAKINEEAGELLNSKGVIEILEECIDVIIASRGYETRFNKYNNLVNLIKNYTEHTFKKLDENIDLSIKRKMLVIENRKYHKNFNGITHHIKE